MMIKKRLFLTLPFIILLLLLIIQAFNYGLSSLFYINFNNFISPPVTTENLSRGQSALNTANEFSADNPQYYLLNGTLKTFQSNAQLSISKRANFLSGASDDYLQAILLQVDNPFSWINLAQHDYYLGKDNYSSYLERALKYGRSEQRVLLVYFNLSLIHWHTMGKEKQKALVKVLQQTILAKDFVFNDSGKQLDHILRVHRLKFTLCGKMIRSKKIRAFCQL